MVDTEYFSLPKLVPSGNILGMDTKRIKEWDNVTSIFTKGITPSGKKVGLQGTAPSKVMYLEGATGNKFAKVEELASLVTWLASEENSFSTAAVFDLSGGRATY